MQKNWWIFVEMKIHSIFNLSFKVKIWSCDKLCIICQWFLNKWMEDAIEIALAKSPGCSSIQASNNLKFAVCGKIFIQRFLVQNLSRLFQNYGSVENGYLQATIISFTQKGSFSNFHDFGIMAMYWSFLISDLFATSVFSRSFSWWISRAPRWDPWHLMWGSRI